jgi:hypothetical protein
MIESLRKKTWLSSAGHQLGIVQIDDRTTTPRLPVEAAERIA